MIPSHDAIQRILIIKWSAMGDVVIATAAMEDVYRAFPGRTIELNTLSPWEQLFENDPRFNDVFAINVRGAERRWKERLRWIRHVRSRRYDLVVDLQSSDHTRALLGALQLTGKGIPHRMGHRSTFPYNIYPSHQDPVAPAHENARRSLEALGIAAETERPVLHVPEEHQARAERTLRDNGLERGRYVVLLPGSQAAGYLKRWGAERFAALGARLHGEGVEHIVVLGGPEETEECARIASLCGPWLVNLCGKTSLFELVPICDGAKAIVGNDTGTAHIASATARPMVVVCGPTDPRRVRPMGRNVETMQTTGLDCINCYCKAPCAHHSCMARITPEAVHETLSEQLGAHARRLGDER